MTRNEIESMIAADERHWWYRGRRRVLRAELDRLVLRPGARILDAGCGSGRTLDELARYGRVTGIDESQQAVAAARSRGHDVCRGRIESLPFADGEFDLTTCLDVVEHTPDDRRTLAELRRVTRRGGTLVVTVPAYQSLFSAHDIANGHHRRYRSSTLRAAALDAGWEPLGDTHFNTLLLGPAVAVRLLRRGEHAAERSELQLTPRWLHGPLEWPLRVEALLRRRGVRLPAGLSLLAVFTNSAAPIVTLRPRTPDQAAAARRRRAARAPLRERAAIMAHRRPRASRAEADMPDQLTGVSIVLPCHDEEANVADAIHDALHAGGRCSARTEVLVVDDGSRDATLAIATAFARRDPRVRVLVHATNRGYGAAVRTGLQAATLPWVFLTDADLQFDLDELETFLPRTGEADIVAGWRIARQDPLGRRVSAGAWNRLVRALFAIPIRDVDCAFKLMRRDVVRNLPLRSDGAMVSTELIVRAIGAGARIEELGVHHRPRVAGSRAARTRAWSRARSASSRPCTGHCTARSEGRPGAPSSATRRSPPPGVSDGTGRWPRARNRRGAADQRVLPRPVRGARRRRAGSPAAPAAVCSRPARLAAPRWLAGAAAGYTGLGLTVAALALAPLSLVQPVIGAGIVVVACGAKRLTGTPVSARERTAAALAVAAVAMLSMAAPAAGQRRRRPSRRSRWPVWSASCSRFRVARTQRISAPLRLGFAAGILYGATELAIAAP